MKATLVFSSHESEDLSVGMVFIPCICWVVRRKIISNPHPEIPNYIMGDFQQLIQLPYLIGLKNSFKKKLILVIHPEGHGEESDINGLVVDIKTENYELEIIRM